MNSRNAKKEARGLRPRASTDAQPAGKTSPATLQAGDTPLLAHMPEGRADRWDTNFAGRSATHCPGAY